MMEEISTQPSIKRRKRKSTSCDSCKKLKTRCEFEVAHNKCHRCGILKLSCSLTGRSIDEKHNGTEVENGFVGDNDKRMTRIEDQMSEMMTKLDYLIKDKVDNLIKKDDEVEIEINQDYKVFTNLINKDETVSDDESNSNQVGDGKSYDDLVLTNNFELKDYELKHSSIFLKSIYGTNLDNNNTFHNDDEGGYQSGNNIDQHSLLGSVLIYLELLYFPQYGDTDPSVLSSLKESLQSSISKLFWRIGQYDRLDLPILEGLILICQYGSFDNSWNISGEALKLISTNSNFKSILQNINSSKSVPSFTEDHKRLYQLWIKLVQIHLETSILVSQTFRSIPNHWFEIFDKLAKFQEPQIFNHEEIITVKSLKYIHDSQLTDFSTLFIDLIKNDHYTAIKPGSDLLNFHYEKLESLTNVLQNEKDHDIEFHLALLTNQFVKRATSLRKRHNYTMNLIGNVNKEDRILEKYIKIGYNSVVISTVSYLREVIKKSDSLIISTFELKKILKSCTILNELDGYCEFVRMKYGEAIREQFDTFKLISEVYFKIKKSITFQNDKSISQIESIFQDLLYSQNEEIDGDQLNSSRQNSNQVNHNNGSYNGGYKPLHDEISYEYSSDLAFLFDNRKRKQRKAKEKGLEVPNINDLDSFEEFWNNVKK